MLVRVYFKRGRVFANTKYAETVIPKTQWRHSKQQEQTDNPSQYVAQLVGKIDLIAIHHILNTIIFSK